MPQGDKRHYTQKQVRKAEHIEQSFRKRGYPTKEAESRAWATVNAIHKGGELKGGSGYGKPEDKSVYRRGGRRGGRASAGRSRAAAKKAAGGTRKSSTGRSATKRAESPGRRQMKGNVRSVGGNAKRPAKRTVKHPR